MALNTFKKFNSKLEQLFDQEVQKNIIVDENLLEAKNKYQASEDINTLKNLSYIFNQSVDLENVENFLVQLSLHFEGVFLFEQTLIKKNYQLKNAHLFNQLLARQSHWPVLTWPNFQLYKVYKTMAFNLLKKIHLAEAFPENKATTFLIKLSETTVVILITTQAEPWARIKITELQETLMKIHFDL